MIWTWDWSFLFHLILFKLKGIYFFPCQANYFFKQIWFSLMAHLHASAFICKRCFTSSTTRSSLYETDLANTNSFTLMASQSQDLKCYRNITIIVYSIQKKPINKVNFKSLKLTFFFSGSSQKQKVAEEYPAVNNKRYRFKYTCIKIQ